MRAERGKNEGRTWSSKVGSHWNDHCALHIGKVEEII